MNKGILVVGLTCVDVVNYMNNYPKEDSDCRVMKQIWTLGGNAANNVTVLNQLNSHTTLFSALPDDNLLVTQGQLEELKCEEFKSKFPNVRQFSWIHFEGRNCDEVLKMIEYVRDQRAELEFPKISIECEKVRPFLTMEIAIPLVDVVFISKDFAKCKGFTDKESAVKGISKLFGTSKSTIICPWGDQGVSGQKSEDFPIISVNAFKESKPAVDTLGAGDCFIGCCINYLNEGCDLEKVLENAARITGKKVVKRGLLNLDVS